MGKYFKYAIGEILLVVIGILIALQINNWNEGQKSKTYENKILKEIRASLTKDLKHTKTNLLPSLLRKEEATASTLKKVAYTIVDHDSVTSRRDLNHIGITLHFIHDRGPYESLKASGLEKISNDSLRSALVRAYEVDLPLRKEQSEQYNAENKLIRDPLYEDLMTFNLVIQNKDSIFVGKSAKFKEFKDHPSLLKYIDLDERVARAYRSWIENDIVLYTNLIEFINIELEND